MKGFGPWKTYVDGGASVCPFGCRMHLDRSSMLLDDLLADPEAQTCACRLFDRLKASTEFDITDESDAQVNCLR